MVDTAEQQAPGRSPIFLIGMPLLVLIGLALIFTAVAREQRSDAEVVAQRVVDEGFDGYACDSAELDSTLDLDGYEPEQPIVISSLTLQKAVISLTRPIELPDDADDDEQPQVDVIELKLEKSPDGWCVASAESSVRLASN